MIPSLDEKPDKLISTVDIEVPAGSLFISESLRLENAGDMLGLLDIVDDQRSLALSREYGDDGSTEAIKVLDLDDSGFFPFQVIDADTKTISGDETIDVTVEVTIPGLSGGARLRGLEGLVSFDVWLARDPNDDNTLTDQELADLPDEDKIVLFNGAQDVENPWDFDNPSNPASDEDEKLFKSNFNLNFGRKFVISYYSVTGDTVVIKGDEVSASAGVNTFIPFQEAFGWPSEDQFIFTSDDAETNDHQGWSSEKIQTELDDKTEEAPVDGKLYSRKNEGWIEDNATDSTYDNTDSTLISETVKTAIDELAVAEVGIMFMTGNTVETVITTSNTYVDIEGTIVAGANNNLFDFDGDDTLIYKGARTITAAFDVSIFTKRASAAAGRVMKAALLINDVVEQEVEFTMTASITNASFVSVAPLETDDEIKMQVQNTQDTANIIFTTFDFRILEA